VTGTSCIITLIAGAPLLDPAISNVATAEGNWGAFVLLESGGDAMRWARRAFHDNQLSYEDIVRRAAEAPAGSDGLFFLPYLVGERFGAHRNSRAQFFGLSARHGASHLHRAVLEGVAFAANGHVRTMEAATGVKLETVVAAGGGAKTELWLTIKASAYGCRIVVPEEPECSVVGCAVLAAQATGGLFDARDAAAAMVRYSGRSSQCPNGGTGMHGCSRSSTGSTGAPGASTTIWTRWGAEPLEGSPGRTRSGDGHRVRRNVAMADAVGMLSIAPEDIAVMAPAAQARAPIRRSASSPISDAPSSMTPASSDATNASPQPTVSTTATGKPGTETACCAVKRSAPAGPLVTASTARPGCQIARTAAFTSTVLARRKARPG
jgi:hypothetical protein